MKKIKEFFSIFLVALILFTSTQLAFTTSAKAQNLYYGVHGDEAFVECQPTWVTGEIIISSTYEGYPVTHFSDHVEVMAYIFGGEVTSVTLPNTIDADRLTGFPFCSCPTAEIIIYSDNTELCLEDNVLYNKDKTKLIRYQNNSESTSFTVPESVVEIADLAFANSNVEELIITGKTIRFNGDNREGFGTHNIKDIYYCGTEDEWYSNQINEVAYLHYFSETTIHFQKSDGEDSGDFPNTNPVPPADNEFEDPSETQSFDWGEFFDSIVKIFSETIIPFFYRLIKSIADFMINLIEQY